MAPENRVVADLAPISRRRFLRWSLLTGSAVIGVGVGVAGWLSRSEQDQFLLPDALHHLTHSEFLLFRRATEVLLPIAGSFLLPISDVSLLRNIDAMMGLLSPSVRKELGAGLAIFDYAALVSGWHGKRFIDLDNHDAVAYFDRWSEGNSVQRALATVVKKFVYVAYWRDPATWPAIEFDGPVSDKWGLPSLGNTPLPNEMKNIEQEGVTP